VRRTITLALAVVITITGRCVALSDDLHVGSNDPKNNQVTVGTDPSAAPSSKNPSSETYHGFFLDLTSITDRQDFATIVDALRHQVDIVEGVGLSQRVLQAFHTVPIVVDEFGCLGSETTTERLEKPVRASGCYGARIPGNLANNEDISHGVVIVRPATLNGPLLLHELLHFYHAHMFPQGFEEPAIRFYYASAKSIYKDPDAYALRDEKEFFAVTASIFLCGKDQHEPFTRAQLKENQPDYYNYLVWLFGFDPRTSPLASAN
jgi:hypothetical protein